MSNNLNITLSCLNGDIFNIPIKSDAYIWELKQLIITNCKIWNNNLCNKHLYLFIHGSENELINNQSLSTLSNIDKLHLFILFNTYKLKWDIIQNNYFYNIIKNSTINICTTTNQLLKISEQLYYGVHYCELIIKNSGNLSDIIFGVVKSDLLPNSSWDDIVKNGYYHSMKWGKFISIKHPYRVSQYKLYKSNKIGILLNYNNKIISFYRNEEIISLNFTNYEIYPLSFCIAVYHGPNIYWGNAVIDINNNAVIPNI